MGNADSAVLGRGVRLGGDRYRLEHLLGRGGMASVWLAQDEVLARSVAVKILSDTIAADPEYLARFQREAQVAARLTHPNLVNIFDFSATDERPYLVMEYIDGGNLAERLAAGMPVKRGRIARELLAALAHIHGAGVLHRDVKPHNVLIGEDGRARLTDFGIAQPHDATSLTQTGQVLGTARYIAPEVMNGEAASEASDLYSLGVLLRECPGYDDDPAPQLETLVARLTAPDPNDRPISASEAMVALTGRRGGQRLELDTPVAGVGTTETAPTERQPLVAGQAVGPEADEELPDEELPPVPPDTLQGTRRRGFELDPLKALGGVLAVGAIVALLAAVIGGGDEGSGGSEQVAGGNGGSAAPADGGAAGTDVGAATSSPDADTGAALNDQGFALIQAGRHDEAIPILQRAVDSFPEGTGDLNYAYALFNLGNALRLAGRPEEAIPILEQRLQIPNQTGVVRRELELARAAVAGEGSPKPPKEGKAKSGDEGGDD
jgi:eukaryotic-like serine/threonine-protein kinase